MASSKRKAMACIHLSDVSNSRLIVAETPSEAAHIYDHGRWDQVLVFTSANDDPWNGRTVYVAKSHVQGITPPVNGGEVQEAPELGVESDDDD